MKVTIHEEDREITYPTLKSFCQNHLRQRIECGLFDLKHWVLRRICQIKGHIRHYNEADPDGKYPFCNRCHGELQRARSLSISPYLK